MKWKKLHFVYQFVTNFSELVLCKINILDFFDMGDFFQIFVISRNTEILIEPNYWLGMNVPFIHESLLQNRYALVIRSYYSRVVNSYDNYEISSFYHRPLVWFLRNSQGMQVY